MPRQWKDQDDRPQFPRRPRRLVEDDRADRLLELLGERQQIVDQLQQAAALLQPLRTAWGETVATLPEAVQDSVRRRLDGVSMLIDRINARDEECRRTLAKRRDEVALELLSIGRGRGAMAAYVGVGAAPVASFQDREA
jgi:hypothetical protein